MDWKIYSHFSLFLTFNQMLIIKEMYNKNNQKFLVDFYYTDSNNNLKTVQFSNRDIKRCIPYQEMYGYHIVTKIAGENMHIAFVFMDLCRKPFAYGQTLKIKPKSFQGWLKEFDIPMDPNILIDGFGALGMPYRPIIGSSNAGIEMWLGFHLDPNLKIFENWKILEFDWKITEVRDVHDVSFITD